MENSNRATEHFRNVSAIGEDVWPFLKVLLLFYEIGNAYRCGARSQAEVIAMLEERDLRGKNHHDLRCSSASVSRNCKIASMYFGRVFSMNGGAPLFKNNGVGKAVNGLTPLGLYAWELTGAFLVSRGIVNEND